MLLSGPQIRIRRKGDLAVKIEVSDLREKARERKMGNTVLFVVDANSSMGTQQQMTAVKGVSLPLLIDASEKRDLVGLVIFRVKGAKILLPLTSSVELARIYPVHPMIPEPRCFNDGIIKFFSDTIQTRSFPPRKNSITIIISSKGKTSIPLMYREIILITEKHTTQGYHPVLPG